MKKTKSHSLATIAAEFGVSKATVSYVLNSKAKANGISPELENNILAFCRGINYLPNIHAQRMNGREVKNIGVLLEGSAGVDAKTPFAEDNIANVLGGVSVGADEAGYRFSIQIYDPAMDENKVFDWFRTKEIAGLVYYGFEMPESWMAVFKKEGWIVVGVSTAPGHGLPSVNIDNFSASFKLTEYLVEKKGRGDFLYIGGSGNSWPGLQRYEGFRKALEKHNVSFNENKAYKEGGFDTELAAEIVRNRWMRGELKEDAIVCANDNMALGVLKILNDAGAKIPDQIAVAGADNIKVGRYITPSLTTFDNLPYEQGMVAVKLLFDIIEGRRSGGDILLNTTLCRRDSA